MSEKEYFTDMILTQEGADNLEKLYERFEKEGGIKVKGKLKLCTDKEFLDRMLEKITEGSEK